MNNQQQLMDNDDVVSILEENSGILISNETFKVKELFSRLKHKVHDTDKNKMEKWVNEGVYCEVLSPNQTWRKEKIKFCLKFIPDELESP